MTNDTMAETWLKSYHENDTKIKYGGRDMVGYGSQTPQFKWPKGAKVALNFVINYEEGGESCLLHGDNKSEKLLSEIVGAPAYGTFRFCACALWVCFYRHVTLAGKKKKKQKTDETSHRSILYNHTSQSSTLYCLSICDCLFAFLIGSHFRASYHIFFVTRDRQ